MKKGVHYLLLKYAHLEMKINYILQGNVSEKIISPTVYEILYVTNMYIFFIQRLN